MDYKDTYPQFAVIEQHIKRARAERSVVIAQMFVDAATFLARGVRKLGDAMGQNMAAERDRRAIEADSFLKRSVPKY